MATGFIPQEIIDEIAAYSDIVEIVNEYVPLKKRGRNFQGLCPFHHEKTPSFTVSPDKQIFRCFGCGVGGNIFSFIMQIEGLNFPEAVEKLAQRAGIPLPKQEMTAAQKEELKQKERWYKINELTAQFYHKILLDTKFGKKALDYLKKRGITAEIIEKFHLGVSLPDWDGLIKFMNKRGVRYKELLELGLILPKNSGRGYYDRFRNRLMFPIWDNASRVIAFGGRVLDDGEPKYLNSPDTPLFNKGYYLYGLHLAKSSIRNEDLAVIVEGYMDVIACHQYGITNVVASLGTALTQQQARALMRHTYNVAIAYDADIAGSNATLRGLDILGDLGCQVRVVNLPKGLDPDEYLRNFGSQEFSKLVAQGENLIEYKLSNAMENVNHASIEGKIKIIQSILPDLYKIDSPVAREGAVKLISNKLGIADTSILSELRKYRQEKQKFPQNKDRNSEKRENKIVNLTDLNKIEVQMLKILFEHNKYFADVEKVGGKELFTSPLNELYQQMVEKFLLKGKVIGSDLNEKDSELLAFVLMNEFDIPNSDKVVADYIKNLQINKLNKDYSNTIKELSEAEKLGDAEGVKKLLSHIEWIIQQKKLLAP
ncbi:MAG: primase [Clostridia bacterium]|jgi:DNA primase|nr:primase [Clostridia bacterium]